MKLKKSNSLKNQNYSVQPPKRPQIDQFQDSSVDLIQAISASGRNFNNEKGFVTMTSNMKGAHSQSPRSGIFELSHNEHSPMN